MQLIQQLVRKGFIKEADLGRIADAEKSANGRPLHEVLIEKGFAKEDDVLQQLADNMGMEFVDLTKITVDPKTLASVPAKLVHRHSLMPLYSENSTLVVPTGNPFDVTSIDEMQTVTAFQIHPLL